MFITWDPSEKVETFTVQPKFEGNALDFGMVIPTPSQPKLHEMPRDFFKHLAIYTIMKRRESPQSKLLYTGRNRFEARDMMRAAGAMDKAGEGKAEQAERPKVIVLEAGVVGSLDYKIIEAARADDLFAWLKENKYSYSGDEATLNHYIQKKWLFTVMKIDTMQMKRNKDGTFDGEVTPTRFQFASEKLIYPLKITQISVRERTEALFYVQAPFKTDLPGDMTYQYNWLTMLQWSMGCAGGIPGRGQIWMDDMKAQTPALMARARELDFQFVARQRPQPNKKGHIPTTMEWARKLAKADIDILNGKAPLQRDGAERGRRLHRCRHERCRPCGSHSQGDHGPPEQGTPGTSLRLPGASCPGRRCQEPATTGRPSVREPVHHEVPQGIRTR